MRTGRLLAVVLVMQGLILAGQWCSSGPLVREAQAQIPDAGSQRIQMIDELRSMNGKLDRLIGLLESGDMQVRAVLPETKKSGGGR